MTTLNDAMEIDHPVWIEPDGTWDDVPRNDFPTVRVPQFRLEVDQDGQLLPGADGEVRATARAAGWDVLDGYSGQHGYSGPIMHASESVRGHLERDILAEPGVYVACVVECGDLDENPAGWVALRLRHADYPHWSGRLYDCAACELGPCTCNPSDAPCVSRHCATPEG